MPTEIVKFGIFGFTPCPYISTCDGGVTPRTERIEGMYCLGRYQDCSAYMLNLADEAFHGLLEGTGFSTTEPMRKGNPIVWGKF